MRKISLLLIILFEALTFFVCLTTYNIPLFLLFALLIPFVLLIIDLTKFIKSSDKDHVYFISFNRILGFVLIVFYLIIWYYSNKLTPGIYNNIYSQIGFIFNKLIFSQTWRFIIYGILSFISFLIITMIPIIGVMIISFHELFLPSKAKRDKHRHGMVSIAVGILLIIIGLLPFRILL